jgi:hypothetical protein
MLFSCKGTTPTNENQTRIDFWVNYFKLQKNPNTAIYTQTTANYTQTTDKCNDTECWGALISINTNDACSLMSASIESCCQRDEKNLFKQWSIFTANYINTQQANLPTLLARFNSAYTQACENKKEYDLELLSIFGQHLFTVNSGVVLAVRGKKKLHR